VQAGKDNRDVVNRAYGELLSAKGSVSVILNKVRIHAPEWVHAEL
jgi:hypothetical protein